MQVRCVVGITAELKKRKIFTGKPATWAILSILAASSSQSIQQMQWKISNTLQQKPGSAPFGLVQYV